MNNDNNQNSGNNIDDILDILQRRKNQDIMNGKIKDDAPTRIDNAVVKPQKTSSFTVSSMDFTAESQNKAQVGTTPEKPAKAAPSSVPAKASEPLAQPAVKAQVSAPSTNSEAKTETNAESTAIQNNNSSEVASKPQEAVVTASLFDSQEKVVTESMFDTKDNAASNKPENAVKVVPSNKSEDDVKVAPLSKPVSSETAVSRPASLPPVKATSAVPSQPSGEIKSVPVPNPVRNDRTKQVPLNTPVSKAVSSESRNNSVKQSTPSQASDVVRKDYPAASTPSSSTNARPVSQQGKMVYPSAETPKPMAAPSGTNVRGTQSAAPARPVANTNGSAAAYGFVSENNVQQKNYATTSKTAKPSGNISLSDFDDKEVEKANKKENKKKNKKKRGIPGWVKVIVYLVIVISVSVLISLTVIKVGNDVFAFVKPDKEITVDIKENASIDDVAKVLKDAGVIEYPWVFGKYADYKIDKRAYLTSDFIPGEHVLNPSMNYDQIIASLCVSSYDKSTVRITIPEGYTFDEILDLFVEEGVMTEEDRENYLTQLQEFPYEYEFITKLEEQGTFDNENRIHRLEGYLFPDTYDFYKNENPVAALDKLFLNFNNKFSDEMYRRAEALGMTVDEVITLASIIEAEGDTPANFAKISSVFHNRLNSTSGAFSTLGSDATTLYAYRIAGYDKKTLGPNETGFDHPYNTYTCIGLPPGPICNPGIEAIYAALYPDDTNYYYFLTMANGETVFAQTAAQHDANIAESNRIAEEMKNNPDAATALNTEPEPEY